MADKKLLIKIGTKGGRKAKKLIGGVASSLSSLAKISSAVGVGLGVLSVKMAGDFSKSLREISTLMDNVTEKDLKNMSKELRNLSGASGLALASLSKAKYDIVSAGFSNAADSANVLTTAAKLAVGGVTSAASAADILTTALNAYGLESSNSTKIADALFTTVKLGKTTMDELSASLGRVLPFARAANLDIEGVGAAMATMTASGINTAEASTALGGAMRALAAPVGKAGEEMLKAKIGIKEFDDGTMDLLGTIKQFEGMDLAAIRKFIPDVTGATAILSMASNFDVLRSNIEGFADSTGAAETAFEKMAQEFNIKMSRLKNNISSGMIEIGNVIIEAITPFIDSANAQFEKIGDIGWDVVGSNIVNNIGEIGQVLMASFKFIFDGIADMLGIAIREWEVQQSGWVQMFLGTDKEMYDKMNKDAKRRLKDWGSIFSFEMQRVMDDVILKNTDTKDKLDEVWGDFDLPPVEVPGEEELDLLEEDLELEAELEQEFFDAALARHIKHQLDKQKANKKFDHVELSSKLKHVGNLAGALGSLNTASKGSALISARLAQAQALTDTYAGASKALAAGVPPWNFIMAASVIAAGLANVVQIESAMKEMQTVKAATGFEGVVDRPTMFLTGEAGAERVSVVPLEGTDTGGQGGPLNITFNSPIMSEDYTESTIIPQIKEAIRRGADLGVA